MSAERDFLQLAQQFSFNRMPELASEALRHASTLERDRLQHEAWKRNMDEMQAAVQRAVKAQRPPLPPSGGPRADDSLTRFETGPPEDAVPSSSFEEHVLGLVDSGNQGEVNTFSINDRGKVTQCMVTIAESYFDEIEQRICRAVLVALDTGGSWRVRPVIYWRHGGRWVPAPQREGGT